MEVKLIANVNVSHEKCADDLAYNIEKIKQAATVKQAHTRRLLHCR